MQRLRRTIAALALVASVVPSGCGRIRWGALPGAGKFAPAHFDEKAFARKESRTYRIATPRNGDPATETVIGAVRRYRIRGDETLLEVARWFDIGYNEIVEANPGVDAMIPPAGAEVVVPTEWVLPCCTYEGIVVNIPEMRLYYYRRSPDDPDTTLVRTYPVGLGRDDRRTPRGRYRVHSKTVDPPWHVPESIRQEHLRDYGDGRRVISGGHPDNPLGKYRIQLSRRIYSIHGTNTPWGIGMQVTHGCVRLYPEDIERFFPLVPIGTPVEFTYQPVKVGRRAGDAYVEVHRDIYRFAPSLKAATRTALARQQLAAHVESRLVDGAVRAAAGVPVRVSGRDGHGPPR